MTDTFDPYYTWLGIPPAEQPPHHYRLLGVNLFEPNKDAIANAADRQMAHVKAQATGQYATVSQRLLTELTQAKLSLLNPQRRAAYDSRLRQLLASISTPVMPVETESEADTAGEAFLETLTTSSRPGAPKSAPKPAPAAKAGSSSKLGMKTAPGSKSSTQTAVKPKPKPLPPLPAPVRIGLQVGMSALTLFIAYEIFGRFSPQLDVLNWFHDAPGANAPVEVANHDPNVTGGTSKTPPAKTTDPANKAPDKTPDKMPEKVVDKTPEKVIDKTPEKIIDKMPDKFPNLNIDKDPTLPNGDQRPLPDNTNVSVPPDPPKKNTPPKPPGKARVPDETARHAAEGTLAEQINGATAQDLITAAETAKTPAERYVLLLSAREAAAKIGDFDVAWKVGLQLIDRFEVKAWDTRAETVLLFQAADATPEICGKLAEQAIKSADENIAKHQWDLAERCAAFALTAGRRANLPDLVRQATLKLVECRKGRGK